MATEIENSRPEARSDFKHSPLSGLVSKVSPFLFLDCISQANNAGTVNGDVIESIRIRENCPPFDGWFWSTSDTSRVCA